MRFPRILSGAIATLIALSGLAQAAEPPPLTVFAAASTSAAMSEIAARHEAQGGGEIRLVFASSGVLARQIANGAPADLFVSANRQWMDWLVARGLLDGAPIPLFGNRLVLVQPAVARETFDLDDSLPARLGGGRLAIGDPGHVPAGIYAKAALESLGLWGQLERSAVLMTNVRAALLLVERGEADAGIVYASDAAISRKVRVAATFPAESHAPIVYPAGIVAAGRTPAASDFARYLQWPDAQAVFRRHGFSVD
jgi:molybdate transport system substrate-binding protein